MYKQKTKKQTTNHQTIKQFRYLRLDWELRGNLEIGNIILHRKDHSTSWSGRIVAQTPFHSTTAVAVPCTILDGKINHPVFVTLSNSVTLSVYWWLGKDRGFQNVRTWGLGHVEERKGGWIWNLFLFTKKVILTFLYLPGTGFPCNWRVGKPGMLTSGVQRETFFYILHIEKISFPALASPRGGREETSVSLETRGGRPCW